MLLRTKCAVAVVASIGLVLASESGEWYPVNVAQVNCPGKSGYATIQIPLPAASDAVPTPMPPPGITPLAGSYSTSPYIFSFFRTSTETLLIDFSVTDAKGKEVAKQDVTLQGLQARRLSLEEVLQTWELPSAEAQSDAQAEEALEEGEEALEEGEEWSPGSGVLAALSGDESVESGRSDESASPERRLSSRRRIGGGSSGGSSYSSPRRRSTYTSPRRRSTFSPAPSPYTSPRRRSTFSPAPSPYISPRRRSTYSPSPGGYMPGSRRRGMSPSHPSRPGYGYSNPANPGMSGYGYGNRNSLQNNFGGRMPTSTNYGYSGRNAIRGGSGAKVAMALGGGLLAGAMSGYMLSHLVHGFNMPNFNPLDLHCTSGIWSGTCGMCQQMFTADMCSIDISPAVNLSRDDLMTTGFIPNDFVSPLTVNITRVVGRGYAAGDIDCNSTGRRLQIVGTEPTAVTDSPNSSTDLGASLFMTMTKVSPQSFEDPNEGPSRAEMLSSALSGTLSLMCCCICCCGIAMACSMTSKKGKVGKDFYDDSSSSSSDSEDYRYGQKQGAFAPGYMQPQQPVMGTQALQNYADYGGSGGGYGGGGLQNYADYGGPGGGGGMAAFGMEQPQPGGYVPGGAVGGGGGGYVPGGAVGGGGGGFVPGGAVGGGGGGFGGDFVPGRPA